MARRSFEEASRNTMDNRTGPDETVYGVWADHSTLRRESLGPIFGRISLGLRGPVDGRWRESYSFIRKDSEPFSRFILDPLSDRISFTFRSTDQAADLLALIERLQLTIELANLHATAAAASDHQRKTGA